LRRSALIASTIISALPAASIAMSNPPTSPATALKGVSAVET
jgi:hypothetical protein